MTQQNAATTLGNTANQRASQLGFWAAMLTALSAAAALGIASTIAPARAGPFCTTDLVERCITYPYTDVVAYVPNDYLWMYPALLMGPLFVILVTCIHHYAAAEQKLFSQIAVTFATISATALVINYYIQFTTVQSSLLKGEVAGLSLFSQYNAHGLFIALEDVGYLLMGVAFLFVAPVFAHSGGLTRTNRQRAAGQCRTATNSKSSRLGTRKGGNMNRATRINVMIIGVIFGISGMTHGLGEILQGNTPTGGFLINAIAAGSSWTRWAEGGEGAFTLIPNFLVTGILAVTVGLAIVIWSLGHVHKPRGPFVFLLLFVLLFLVGGGIGQVIFFIPAWAVATRIHKPLIWWRRMLPAGLRRGLAQLWPWSLTLASLLILIALVTATFGYLPYIQDLEQVLNLTLSMVGTAWGFFLLAFVAGFARDIEHGMQPAPVARARQAAYQ